MPLRLRDHLHWCQCSGRIVFLDVLADRYFCLPSAANDAFLRVAAGQADPLDTERLRMLLQRGLLMENAGPAAFRRPPVTETPTHDLLDNAGVGSSSVGALLGALAREAQAAWWLRTRPFADVIARAARRRAGPGQLRGTAVRSIAAAADAISLLTRSHNRCLVRALAVHAACRARGIAAQLVLGVIGHPFAAHSWVQVGDAVLVGGYEQARLHTPILVVG